MRTHDWDAMRRLHEPRFLLAVMTLVCVLLGRAAFVEPAATDLPHVLGVGSFVVAALCVVTLIHPHPRVLPWLSGAFFWLCADKSWTIVHVILTHRLLAAAPASSWAGAAIWFFAALAGPTLIVDVMTPWAVARTLRRVGETGARELR